MNGSLTVKILKLLVALFMAKFLIVKISRSYFLEISLLKIHDFMKVIWGIKCYNKDDNQELNDVGQQTTEICKNIIFWLL